jgi:hypothetical protein
MQSKLAHAAERKAFSLALDAAIKGVKSDHPEQAVEKFLDMGVKLLSDTAPDMAISLRKAFYPGSKWGKLPDRACQSSRSEHPEDRYAQWRL